MDRSAKACILCSRGFWILLVIRCLRGNAPFETQESKLLFVTKPLLGLTLRISPLRSASPNLEGSPAGCSGSWLSRLSASENDTEPNFT